MTSAIDFIAKNFSWKQIIEDLKYNLYVYTMAQYFTANQSVYSDVSHSHTTVDWEFLLKVTGYIQIIFNSAKLYCLQKQPSDILY